MDLTKENNYAGTTTTRSVRVVIAGVSQNDVFSEICLIADYISQKLPYFCWERIEIAVLEWEAWLRRLNQKNNWHHVGSPLVWKELYMKGSKPFYIGGASDFLEYCHSYYDVDVYLAPERIEGLTANFAQFRNHLDKERRKIIELEERVLAVDKVVQKDFVVCISGAGHPLAMHLISGLLDMAIGDQSITKIYIYDNNCSKEFLEYVERDSTYVRTDHTGKTVRYVDRIGKALTQTDLLIILDHVPFNDKQPIGDWLAANKIIMKELASVINASASRKMYVLFPNVGPACFNASYLARNVQLKSENIVVATSDLGLEVSAIAAEIAEVPLRNMFCPPVWGFVGINHLVDYRSTVHRYDSFEPYKRFLKVRNSTLTIGRLTPELRTMDYLLHFDESLWSKVVERQRKMSKNPIGLPKVLAVLHVVKTWLFERNPEHIVCLGIGCDGSFGLTFKGKFSQPARFVYERWVPAGDYLLPKDPQMPLKYLQEMAEFTLNIKNGELPPLVPYVPCVCKRQYYKKGVWF